MIPIKSWRSISTMWKGNPANAVKPLEGMNIKEYYQMSSQVMRLSQDFGSTFTLKWGGKKTNPPKLSTAMKKDKF